MSILVYTESENGKFKKTAYEATSYARAIADQMGTQVTAVSIHGGDANELGKYGASKVIEVTDPALASFNASAYAETLTQIAQQQNAQLIIFSNSANAKYITPLVAVPLQASVASNVIALPENLNPFQVKSSVFSNKAFAINQLTNENKIISLSKNAFGLLENPTAVSIESFSPTLSAKSQAVKTVSVDKVSGQVAIADAEIVVSGGRGLKGPENWGLIEDLAQVLGAATACSKPVSDMGWRPHSEHVGQTGKPVASNLYIAIGISGAIQHLAGVNASKVKVVINNDPEAPFFKAADYGVVGDAFEIVPKLTEKLKQFKAENA